MRLILHAPNVHQGGGRALLVPLLEAVRDIPCIAQLDARLEAGVPATVTVRRVKPSLRHRLAAEWFLRGCARPDDLVLCFGNLPPLFPLSSRTLAFVQNRYLVDPAAPLGGFPLKAALRLRLERMWLAARKAAVHTFIVQSESMRAALAEHLGAQAWVLPFAAVQVSPDVTAGMALPAQYDFLYVASGEPQKNHRVLLAAWALLAAENIRPHLCLTLSRRLCPDLCAWIDCQIAAHGLRVTNVDEVGHGTVADLYRQSAALIFPSTVESFGLPLLEASRAELPVLAAERDYVRDLLDPAETFDPTSPRSIARAVKRFVKLPESRPAVVDAAGFLERITRGAPAQ